MTFHIYPMGQKPYSRTVQDLGNGSYGVTIPKELLEENSVGPGDEVPLDYDRDEDAVKYLLGD